MGMILSIGSVGAHLPRHISVTPESDKPGIMVGLAVALALAAPFWIGFGYAIRAIMR